MRTTSIEFLLRALERPALYIACPTIDGAIAFVMGYDAAIDVLLGFREWLEMRAGGTNNLAWCGKVLKELLPGSTFAERCALSYDEHKVVISEFRRILSEFWEEMGNHPDWGKFFYKHHLWKKALDEARNG